MIRFLSLLRCFPMPRRGLGPLVSPIDPAWFPIRLFDRCGSAANDPQFVTEGRHVCPDGSPQ